MLRLFNITGLCFLAVAPTIIADGQCSLGPQPFLLRLSNCSILADFDYPDGANSWGLLVSIALPPQELCVVPSTVVNNTAIVGAEICSARTGVDADQCISSHGGFFNESYATSAYNTASAQDILAPDDTWNQFNPPFTKAGNASIQFSSITLPNFPIAIISSGKNFSESQLGLANDSVFLRSIVSAGLSPVAGFGMLAGSQSVSAPRSGHIVFGGYDAASLAGPFVNYSISNTAGAGNRVCPLQVVVEELTLIRPGFLDYTLVAEGDPMPSCIEPYDNLFRLPPSVLQSFQLITGGLNDSSLLSPQLYVIEPGLLYNTSFNGTLRFKLQGGLEVEIPNIELAQPPRGLDQTGKMVLQNNITQVNIFSQGDPLGTASLGKVFLSQLYLTVNYDKQQFQLAPAVTDTDVFPDLVSLNPSISVNCPPGAPDHWWIGVLVLSCVLAIIMIVVCIYFLRRRRIDNRLQSMEAMDNADYMKAPVETSNMATLETSQGLDNTLQRELSGDVRPSIISVGTANETTRRIRRESSFRPVSPHTEGTSSPIRELPISPFTDVAPSSAKELPVSHETRHLSDYVTELADDQILRHN